MSRIIVKNIPKVFSQKEVQEHFNKVGVVTDCKIARTPNGESRRFAFIGFKDSNTAAEVKSSFNNTYMGASKILIDIARLKNEQNQSRQRTREKDQGKKRGKKQKEKTEIFENFKKIIQQKSKKSWDDLLVPQHPNFEQDKQAEKQSKQKSKKQSKQKPTQAPQIKQVKQETIKPIKAPKISEKNKKYVTKALEIDSNRLYITNIPYTLQEEDIKGQFGKYGNITRIKLPKQYDGKNKGYFFITFQKSEQALRAFSQSDNKVVFGRIIHVQPSLEDIGNIIKTGKEQDFQKTIKEKYGDSIEEKSSFKKQKKRQMRQRLNDTTSWNTLFLNPNTILQRIAKKLHITKSDILLSDNLAPKVALAEAEVIQQTKAWMNQNGINLDFMEKDRNLCQRSKKTVLIKNLNYRTQESELRELLEFYGILQKLLMAPNRAIAIAEFQTPQFAENVMKSLQQQKFKNNFLYIEYAPVGMVNQETLAKNQQKAQKEQQEAQQLSKVVYVKNLSFNTDQSELYQLFEKIDPIKYAKIVRSKDGRSMGFGFVEYNTTQKAIQAVKKLNNSLIDGHKLLLSLSRKKAQSMQDIAKLKEKVKMEEQRSSKLMIRNVAFQATKNDITELFKQFGSLKKVRLPKKMNGEHRGFAFVEYDTAEEAALAREALGSAHLYGRKLVIEYEKGS